MASQGYYGGAPQEQSYQMNNQYQQQPPQQYQQYQQEPQYQQPQQYQQYQQAPPQYGQPMPGYGPSDPNKGTFDQAFKIDKPKYNDVWAGVLFLAVFAGFVAVSGITLQGYSKYYTGGSIYNSRESFGLNSNTIILFAFVLVMAFVLSTLYVFMIRAFTKQLIWITGILQIVFGFVTAIYMLARKYYSGGIVFLIFSVLSIVFFISWIPRIPFSVLMLQTSIDVSKKFGHVYMVSIVGGFIAIAFAAWYSVTLTAIYAKFEPSSTAGGNAACSVDGSGCSIGKVIGLIVFITFAMYWISEFIKNAIHTTISGVYGSWYFMPNNFPKGATRGALRRTMTYSFGSVSFGSLILAIINCLRQLCSMAQNQASQQGNIIGTVVFCCLQCLIGLLEWAVQFFNRYAFSHIALYGKSYIGAAKDTWKMIKDRGIDALVNECLIGPVMTMGATAIAYLCALLAYLYIDFTKPAYNESGGFTPVVVAFAFLIGLQVANIMTTPLSSGIDTIFVACAWDPETLMKEHPDLYQRMVQVYPHVQEAIHA